MRFQSLIAVVLCGAAMAWLAARYEDWGKAFPLTGQKVDYYNLLIDGFREGHLHMKAEVDPRRYSPDENVRREATYLMDASEYQGRYYLYFGVVPALLAFWPYAVLTGHDLPPNLAVLLASLGGFLVYLSLYKRARGRHFSTISAKVNVVSILLLAFGSCTPAVLKIGEMYEVAIAFGYLFTALTFYCLYCLLHTERRQTAWVAAASLAYGLSVGCRPTLFLLGPLVFLGAWFARHRARISAESPSTMRLAVAAVAPALFVGLGLMAYNHARFGNPLEFGHHYQLNAVAGKPLYRMAFIPLNVGWYYFTAPVISPYFPYIFPLDTSNAPADYFGSEPIHGQWPAMLLTIGCLVGLARIGLRQYWQSLAITFRQFLQLAVIGFMTMILVTSIYGVRSNRYMVDFQAILVLLLALFGSWLSQAPFHPRLAKVWHTCYCCLATVLAIFNILIALQLLGKFADTHANTYRLLADYGNRFASGFSKTGLLPYGPLRFKVTFAPQQTPAYEALLSTGTPGYKDILYAAQYPSGYVDFVLYHEGHGGARSALLQVEYGRPYEIEVDMGSLYPPATNHYFPAWHEAANPETLKSFARVAVNGTAVIQVRQNFYDSPPAWLHFGRAPGRGDRGFSGTISDIKRLAPRNEATLRNLAETGIWSLELDIPNITQTTGQPILSSGRTGAGNLLFLEVLSPDTFRLGLDVWGWGANRTPPIHYQTPGPHRLDIFVGAQVARHFGATSRNYTAAAMGTAESRLHVWLDGRLVMAAELPAFRDSYDFVGIGTNTQGFSSAQSDYAARLRRLPLSSADIQILIEKNLAIGAGTSLR